MYGIYVAAVVLDAGFFLARTAQRQQTRKEIQMPTAIRKPPTVGNALCPLYHLAERTWRGGYDDMTGDAGAILVMGFFGNRGGGN